MLRLGTASGRVMRWTHTCVSPASPPHTRRGSWQKSAPPVSLRIPVVIVSVSPVVSVAVLVVGPLPGQAVGPVAGTVAVHVPPVPVVVVLVPMLFILVVPVTPPGRVAVASAVAELPFPLPVSSICGKASVSHDCEG